MSRMTVRPVRRVKAALGAAATTVALVASATVEPAPVFAQDVIERQIHLGPGADESQVIITWNWPTLAIRPIEQLRYHRTDDPGTEQVVDGTWVDYLNPRASNHVVLSGLEPGTSYTYQVGSEASGWTEPREFTTGSDADSWNFLDFTDAQIGVNLGIAKQTETWNNTIGTALADFPNTSLILHTGDQIEGWGDPNAQYDGFFSAPAVSRIPTAVVPGNHEQYALPMNHYDERFTFPNRSDDKNMRDYWFEYNNVLFVGLDSNRNSAADIDLHADFLRQAVAAKGEANDWIVVFFHHAPFSQGSHVADGDVVSLRDNLAPVVSEVGADLVLNGHDHIYTRSHLMEGSTPVVPDTRAERGDVLYPTKGQVLYITTTTAGAGKFYDFYDINGNALPGARREFVDPALEQPWTAYWRQDYTPDYLDVEVTPESLTMTTYDGPTPNVVDKVTLRKQQTNTPTTPPSTSVTVPTTSSSATSTPSTSSTTTGTTTTARTTTTKPTTSVPTSSSSPSTTPTTTVPTTNTTSTATSTKTTTNPSTTNMSSTSVTNTTTTAPTTTSGNGSSSGNGTGSSSGSLDSGSLGSAGQGIDAGSLALGSLGLGALLAGGAWWIGQQNGILPTLPGLPAFPALPALPAFPALPGLPRIPAAPAQSSGLPGALVPTTTSMTTTSAPAASGGRR